MRNYFNTNVELLTKMAAILRDQGFTVTVRVLDACDWETVGPSYLTTNASNHAIMAAWRG